MQTITPKNKQKVTSGPAKSSNELPHAPETKFKGIHPDAQAGDRSDKAR